jgi:single-strand DNA-binding protein
MGSVNLIMVMGEVEQDAQLKDVNGAMVAKFKVTTRERWTDTKGKRHERIDIHPIALWGRHAEALSPRLTRGQQVYVEGKITTDKWQDQQGQTRYDTSIRAWRVDIVSQTDEELAPPTNPFSKEKSHEDDAIF